MLVRCSYCHKSIREIEPIEDDRVSHGMCDECLEHFLPQWDGQTVDAYLEDQDQPTVILDGERRLLAAVHNAPATLLTDHGTRTLRLNAELIDGFLRLTIENEP